jgi:hypothetical protein
MSKKKKQKKLKKYIRKVKRNRDAAIMDHVLRCVDLLSDPNSNVSSVTILPPNDNIVNFKDFEKEVRDFAIKNLEVARGKTYIDEVIERILVPRILGKEADEVDVIRIGVDTSNEVKIFSYKVNVASWDLNDEYDGTVFFVTVKYNFSAKPGEWLYKFITSEDPYGRFPISVEPVFTVYSPISEE